MGYNCFLQGVGMFLYLIVILLLSYFLHFYVTNRKFFFFSSPGFCLPFIGHMYTVLKGSADPINHLWNLYKKHHGGQHLLFVRKMTINFVYVGDISLLKTLLNNPSVQERDVAHAYELTKEAIECTGNSVEHTPGLVMSNGKLWSDQRRFTLRALRDFGYGKRGLEHLINEEVASFITHLQDHVEEEMEFNTLFNIPIVNALWKITAGERFEYDDGKLLDILDQLNTVFKMMMSPPIHIVYAYPWLSKTKLFRSFLGWDKYVSVNMSMINMMKEVVKKRKDHLDINDPKDFTDKILIEIQNTHDPESSFYGEKGEENLVKNLYDIFAAGSETTSTTLSWAVLHVVRHPRVQEKVYEEIASISGTCRLPTLEERPRLPFTEAVIMEIQRLSNIAPEGLHHRCKTDVHINGVIIPKDTLVVPLFVEFLKGDSWDEGEKFKPERFLDEAGGLKKFDEFIPFSIGRRQCLGETLAKAELFLFFAGLLQNFKVLPLDPDNLPSDDYQFGLTVLPVPYKVKLEMR